MSKPLHPLFRSERRAAWVLQLLVVVSVLVVLVVDVIGDGPPNQEAVTPEAARTNGPATPEDATPDAGAPTTVSTQPAPTTAEPVRTFTLVATGDIISHGAVAERADANVDDGWDFSEMFRRVRPILAGADLALCHLESPLSMDDDDLSFRGTFRVPSSLADAIAGAGYDGCSLASNHALDSGLSTVESTLHHLRRVGLATAGMADHAEAAGPAWFDPGGIRVAHLSVTDLLNGRDLPTDPPWLVGHLDVDLVAAHAAAAVDAGAEFVVVSVHWGEEYRTKPTARQLEAADRLLRAPDDNPCRSCPPHTQDGIIAWFEVADVAGGPQVVDAGYVPTWVDRTNAYEIVPIGIDNPDHVDPAVLAASAARTAAVVEPDLRRLQFTAG